MGSFEGFFRAFVRPRAGGSQLVCPAPFKGLRPSLEPPADTSGPRIRLRSKLFLA